MSSTTTSESRSSSPATPATPDSPGYLHTPVINDDMEISSWYSAVTASDSTYWRQDSQHDFEPGKHEEDSMMLTLDDLIQEHAYDEWVSSNSSSCSILISARSSSSSASPPSSAPARTVPKQLATPLPSSSFHISESSPSSSASAFTSEVIPRFTALPERKRATSSNSHVVRPPRESCSSLQIMTPSIPATGAKSRVETQIRVSVDLAHTVSLSGEYDRVGSWKWICLPKGAATKKRTRKEGKIDPKPEDTLYLTAEVTCASPPHAPVSKRVARKIAQRVRPQRPDSDSPDSNADPTSRAPFTIVQFNCAEVLEYDSGTAVLPLRITCYCRHHRERIGFHVHFKMSDHTGRVVATGRTAPIMITDDHKSTSSSAKQTSADTPTDAEIVADASSRPGSKRKCVDSPETSQKRARNAQFNGVAPGSPAASVDSPSNVPTREATPAQAFGPSFASFASMDPAAPPTSDDAQLDSLVASTLASISSPGQVLPIGHPLSPSAFLPTAPSSPRSVAAAANAVEQALSTPTAVPPLPFLFFQSNPPSVGLPKPRIHRLIPAQGPCSGGIEVTVLGANFPPGLQLDCVFGDVVASRTDRWSENTLVCLLPPRAVSGVVGVWFNGIPKEEDGSPPCLFTYVDESERSLCAYSPCALQPVLMSLLRMELALQVVGLKMTGKIEDAKSIAMRIIAPENGNGSSSSALTSSVTNNLAQLASSWSLDLRGAGSHSDVEKLVLQTLALLDMQLDTSSPAISIARAISHANGNGQSLLHLAAFGSLPGLVRFLIRHGADLDARDRNGFTALHFAGFIGARQCARLLLDAGADAEIVDASGRTAQELAAFNFASVRATGSVEDGEQSSSSVEEVEDEESRWGDAEEESEVEVVIRRRRPRNSRRADPAPRVVSSSEDEKRPVPRAETDKMREATGANDKQVESLLDTLQRKFAPAQGLLPQLAVPWLPLPQMPTVFPAFFHPQLVQDVAAVRAFLTPQEWRAYWEKWMILSRTQQHDEPPPMYTPRVEVDTDTKPTAAVRAEPVIERTPETVPAAESVQGPSSERTSRRAVYKTAPPVPAREVDAYTYRPVKQHGQKEDKMLLLFWIPILIIALIWAFVHGVRLGLHGMRSASLAPIRAIMRV
ncbi:hypothetical protein K488DRAFT_72546 [Vararia minispora EC-137]|uniref:Uncharacterized protein n=1 Tax=Vararia minispora EC-137 TaxID=1314806 RepID=A0ACB8QEE5_9AGAM|nr:hypothetical protein K488DRAFT_72546 [Vararia minispora EC-137]